MVFLSRTNTIVPGYINSRPTTNACMLGCPESPSRVIHRLILACTAVRLRLPELHPGSPRTKLC